jgi:hypothetical protein
MSEADAVPLLPVGWVRGRSRSVDYHQLLRVVTDRLLATELGGESRNILATPNSLYLCGRCDPLPDAGKTPCVNYLTLDQVMAPYGPFSEAGVSAKEKAADKTPKA